MSVGSTDVPTNGERRLAAIVFSDVVGYSARMQRDETATMALVGIDFARMTALAAGDGGEVLNTMGDGMLLSFSSAVHAVKFALQAQTEFAHRSVTNPPEKALVHRIGIHVGDVFRVDGRVAGDGVNIASRLQAKAPPGGICVSQTVCDLIKGKITVQALPLGPQEFKNITGRIPVYQLALPLGAGRVNSRPNRAGLVAAVISVLLAAIGAWWGWHRPGRGTIAGSVPSGNVPTQAAVIASPEVPVVSDKSIAVLPFVNMSDNKENAYFADGVQEDLLTSLANIGDLRVISRTSVIQYRDSMKPLRQIAAELGVSYVLEGSVQRVGNRVLVTGQLINARTDQHIWAKSYDRELTDIFAIQAELTKAITVELQAVLSPQEEARLNRPPTDNAAAYDLYLKAWQAVDEYGFNVDGLSRAEPLLESAVELDPKFAVAWGILAANQDLLASRVDDTAGVHREKARHAIEMMKQIAPDQPDTWLRLSDHFLSLEPPDFAQSDSNLLRASQALPNNAFVVLALAERERRHGQWSNVLGYCRRAYALDWKQPAIAHYLGTWLVTIRHFDDAKVFARHNLSDAYLLADIPYVERGSTTELNAWAAVHAKASPDFASTIYASTGEAAEYVRTLAGGRQNLPNGQYSVAYESTYATALMALGLTDQAQAAARRNAERLKGTEDWNGTLVAMNLSVLGDYQGALSALDATRARFLRDGVNPDFRDNTGERVVILALLGRKAEAVAELGRLLKIPCGLNVNFARHNWQYSVLKADPVFENLLSDPSNNAPIL
jgi:TolB-like protein/class 3 adenylate cyclase